jgi:hypothetical protein
MIHPGSFKTRDDVVSALEQGTGQKVGEKVGIAFPDAVASTKGEPVKAVNEGRAAAKSNPIEVFHSTNADFTEFDQGKSIGGQMWFTSSKDMAEAGFDGAQSGRVVKAQIDIRNPAGWDEYDKFGTDELIAQGFDGVKLESGDEISYIAFFPEQVKVDSNLPSIGRNVEKVGEKVEGTQIGGGFANSTLEKMWRGTSTPRLQRILKTYEDDLYKAGSREGAYDPRDWDKWVEHKKFIEDELANRGAKLKPKAARKVVPVTPDKKLTDEAFKHYGETGMASDTGYIMADGRQLDLSGANQGGTPGIRSLDHRDVTGLEGMKTPGDEPTKSMFEFQNRTGAIRTHVSDGDVYVSLTTKPTDEAFDKLMLLVEARGGGLVLDVDNGKTLGTIANREWDKVNPSEVRRFIDEALGRVSPHHSTGQVRDSSGRFKKVD